MPLTCRAARPIVCEEEEGEAEDRSEECRSEGGVSSRHHPMPFNIFYALEATALVRECHPLLNNKSTPAFPAPPLPIPAL